MAYQRDRRAANMNSCTQYEKTKSKRVRKQYPNIEDIDFSGMTKAQIRKEKNKISAAKSRQRQAQEMEDLKNEVKMLKEALRKSNEENARLRRGRESVMVHNKDKNFVVPVEKYTRFEIPSYNVLSSTKASTAFVV
jgi:hypothetical protein